MRGNQLPVSATGGSMVPRYVLELLFSEKIVKIDENSTTTKGRLRIRAYLESLEF
jgi:hypothetical protein